jgi:hypothetical protein
MGFCSFAQEYPKLYNKQQKLYLITEPQLKTTIKMGVKIDMCDEKLQLCINSNKIKDAQKNLLIESFGMCEQKVVKQGLIIDEQKNQLNTKDKIIKEQKSQLKTQKRKKIAGGTIGFGLGVIAGVITTTYLIK